MEEKLILKKKMKGEDGYKTFSVGIPDGMVEKLEDLSSATNRSRNELINLLSAFALEHCEVK
ncbi:MAG: CopG family transcriptional regulator [Clostridia bacterium]|nr:CopG family transcriptional regulator [Clostridia bacterium]